MTTRISTFELEGQRYAVVPLELLSSSMPELLEAAGAEPEPNRSVPNGDDVPWVVVRQALREDTSLIRPWRQYLGLTQHQVAARIGISQAALAQIERSKRPRKATLQRLAVALGISYEQLVG
jgi:DNA-binding XRE family transcriptional regulator